MAGKTTSDVLQRVQETLQTAKLGLRDVIEGRPERRLGGLRNLVVSGRAVTNVLQNLRSIEPTFDNWYKPYVAEMRADLLLRYFYTLRSQILKERTLNTGASMYISHFEFPRDMQRLGPPPRPTTGARGSLKRQQTGASECARWPTAGFCGRRSLRTRLPAPTPSSAQRPLLA